MHPSRPDGAQTEIDRDVHQDAGTLSCQQSALTTKGVKYMKRRVWNSRGGCGTKEEGVERRLQVMSV